MGRKPLTLEAITASSAPYARGEADAQSDLDFLVLGRDGFRLTEILLRFSL